MALELGNGAGEPRRARCSLTLSRRPDGEVQNVVNDTRGVALDLTDVIAFNFPLLFGLRHTMLDS